MEEKTSQDEENGFYFSKGKLKNKSLTSEQEKKYIIDKFYNLIMRGTNEKTKIEMTDYILKLEKYNSIPPEEIINIIPENLIKLRELYKREYFIRRCEMFGLLDFCGIKIITLVLKSKK
jgi:hypothetical protein